MKTREIFCNNFKKLLNTKKCSLSEISRQIGYPIPTLESWYLGSNYPRPEAIDCLADFFCVPITYFFMTETDKDYEIKAIKKCGRCRSNNVELDQYPCDVCKDGSKWH